MSSKDIEFYSPNQDSTEWEKLLVKTKWSLIEGKPTTFTPTSHNHDDLYLKKGTAKVTVETDSYTLDTTPIDETVEVKYIEGNITTVVEGEFVVSKPTQIVSGNEDDTEQITYPLSGNIELPKLPNGVGDIWLPDGSVERNVGKINLWDTDTSRFTTDSSGHTTNFYSIYISNIDNYKLQGDFLISSLNAIRYNTISGYRNADELAIFTNPNYPYIYFKLPRTHVGGIADARSYCLDNNVVLYYELEIPTIENAPMYPKYIATFDRGHIEIDDGRMSLEIPVNITDQVNVNTNHIHNITSGLNQFVKKDDNIPISKIVTDPAYEGSILIGSPENGIGTLSQSTFAPASHPHLVQDIQNLDNEIDGRVFNATNGIFLPINSPATDSYKLGGNSPSYYQNASNLNAGTVPIARLPVGTSSDKVAAGNHTHSGYVQSIVLGDTTYMPTGGKISLPAYNPQSLTVKLNGVTKATYDGSTAEEINITPASIDTYTKSQIDNMLDYKANATDIPTAIKNPHSLTVKQNGETLATYDGSSAETVNIEGYTLTPLRTRAETTSLTSVASGDTVGSVPLSSTVGRGDTLLIELNTISSYTYSHKYIMVTLGTDSTSPNSTSGYRNFSFSTFNGTDFNIYSFTVSASGSTLYFGSKKNLNGVFSGTTIAWTTADYTLYVGKVWKVN